MYAYEADGTRGCFGFKTFSELRAEYAIAAGERVMQRPNRSYGARRV